MRRLFPLMLAAALFACGDDDPNPSLIPDAGPPGHFGDTTSAVVIVNPIINAGSSTSVGSGAVRAGVSIQAAELPSVVTDATGLAVIGDLPLGSVPLKFDTGTVNLGVVQEKELYDVVVAFTPGGVTEIVPAIRYPVGGEVKLLEAGASIAEAAAEDGAILVLGAGSFPGGFELTSEGVLVFGTWSPVDGQQSVIEGDVTVKGGNIRMRGVKVTGLLTSNANNFSAAFCDLSKAHITGNGVTLIRNRFVDGEATVPSSSSVLVDNEGLPAK